MKIYEEYEWNDREKTEDDVPQCSLIIRRGKVGDNIPVRVHNTLG